MDFELEFDVLNDLYVRPAGHSFFSARMRPEIAVGCINHGPEWAPLGTGTIVDSEGNLDEAGTREKLSDWAAYHTFPDAVKKICHTELTPTQKNQIATRPFSANRKCDFFRNNSHPTL